MHGAAGGVGRAAGGGGTPHVARARPTSVEPAAAAAAKGQLDTFGMPELAGAWSGGLVAQSLRGIARGLRSDRACDSACMQRAVAAARNKLPTADMGLVY